MALPIVVTSIPMSTDTTEPGRNSDVVPVNDPAALAGALVGLLADRERREAYGAHSFKLYEERYRMESVMDRMANLYRSVAATR